MREKKRYIYIHIKLYMEGRTDGRTDRVCFHIVWNWILYAGYQCRKWNIWEYILSRAHEILCRAHEILSHALDILSRAHDILIRAHEILNRAHEIIKSSARHNKPIKINLSVYTYYLCYPKPINSLTLTSPVRPSVRPFIYIFMWIYWFLNSSRHWTVVVMFC